MKSEREFVLGVWDGHDAGAALVKVAEFDQDVHLSTADLGTPNISGP